MSDKFSTAQEAKDFLIEKAVSQAAIENIPLSDPERRLMYYSVDEPSDESLPNPDDDSTFEEKVSGLIRRAWKNDPEKGAYKAAFKKLSEGDHYLSVMNPFSRRYGTGSSQTEWYPNPFYWAGGRSPFIASFKSTPLRKSGPLFLWALVFAAALGVIAVYWEPAKESFWHWYHHTR